jgi:hypothetical protein
VTKMIGPPRLVGQGQLRARPGHFLKADLGHSWEAPKRRVTGTVAIASPPRCQAPRARFVELIAQCSQINHRAFDIAVAQMPLHIDKALSLIREQVHRSRMATIPAPE